MNLGLSTRTRAALAALLAIASAGLAACDSEQEEANAAANAVELARYLPEDTPFLHSVDLVKARDELELPDDANALPTSNRTLPRPNNPEATLFQIASRAYPDVADALEVNSNGRGASPLDGTLIRAAAGGAGGVSIVSTSEPVDDIDRKLRLAGYSLENKIYKAGDKTPTAASRYVADAGNGRFVFADKPTEAQEILRRMRNEAQPGNTAEALEPAAGSVRLAMANQDKRSCVTDFSAAMEATGEGAALALIVAGDKPEPERFRPKALKGMAAGTPTVLVDALIVPIRVKKPLKDGIDALQQVISFSDGFEVTRGGETVGKKPFAVPPFKSYDCP